MCGEGVRYRMMLVKAAREGGQCEVEGMKELPTICFPEWVSFGGDEARQEVLRFLGIQGMLPAGSFGRLYVREWGIGDEFEIGFKSRGCPLLFLFRDRVPS